MKLTKNICIVLKNKLKLYSVRFSFALAYTLIWRLRLNIYLKTIILFKCIIKIFFIIQTVDFKEVDILLTYSTYGNCMTVFSVLVLGLGAVGLYGLVKERPAYVRNLKSAQENLNDVVEKHGEIGTEIINQAKICDKAIEELKVYDNLIKDFTLYTFIVFAIIIVLKNNEPGGGVNDNYY